MLEKNVVAGFALLALGDRGRQRGVWDFFNALGGISGMVSP